MLINLLPDFFAVHNSTDRVAAYLRYFETHRRFLEAYWHNYVLDPAGPHFLEVVRSAALASRVDLRTMLERIDVVSLARNTEEQCRALLNVDTDIDVVLMVGVGAAHAGELVVDGKGIAFVCLEHFTSVTNPETQGLGLDPELIPGEDVIAVAAPFVANTTGSASDADRALRVARAGFGSFTATNGLVDAPVTSQEQLVDLLNENPPPQGFDDDVPNPADPLAARKARRAGADVTFDESAVPRATSAPAWRACSVCA